MKSFQPYVDFTAQGLSVRALMTLYSRIEERELGDVDLLPFVVFMAFSVEAYLNSVGSRHIPYWEDLERLPWKSKLSILHKHVGKKPRWGHAPLQFCNEMFQLRDKLAHGKPERVLGPICASPTDALTHISGQNSDLEPIWYKSLTKQWVIEAKDRYRALMSYIASLYNLGESDHLLASTGSIMEIDSNAA